MELTFAILAAFVIYLVRLWWTNRKPPQPARAVPLMRKWGADRSRSVRTDKGRWDADFEALDEPRRLAEAQRQREQTQLQREQAEREQAMRQLMDDYERFKRANPAPPVMTSAKPSEAEVFARLRAELDSL